jgi:putative SOS response-associated peptidase YedK
MVLRRHPETGGRRLDALRWGLVPSWTKVLKQARKPINARSETAGSSSMFRSALAIRRCIVPADAFYEWRALTDGKQLYAIARRDGTPLAFAWVWEGWRAPDGETLCTYSILTTAANATMGAIHDRMPVILDPDDWHAWLDDEDVSALTGCGNSIFVPGRRNVDSPRCGQTEEYVLNWTDRVPLVPRSHFRSRISAAC